MKLRTVTKNDFSLIKELDIEFYDHHKKFKTLLQDIDPRKYYLKKDFISILDNKNKFFKIAVIDEVEAGYIYGVIKKLPPNEKNFKKMGIINSIVVSRKYRNKGIASYMLKELIKWFKSKEVKYVEARCNVKNDKIIKLNRKLGLKEYHYVFGGRI